MRIQLHKDGEKKKQNKTHIMIKDEVRDPVTRRYSSSALYLACMCASQFVPGRRVKSARTTKRCCDQKAACKKVFGSISSVPIALSFRTHVRRPHTFLEALGEMAERVPWSRH